MTRSGDELKYQYFATAMQYYDTARFAAVPSAAPVVGLLFHYALEMFLKGQLCLRLSEDDLKNRLRHNLKKIWKEFKQDFPDPALDKFNPTIAMVEKFWRIRYPEEIVKKGMMIRVNFEPPTAPLTGKRPEPKYDLIVDDIDELVEVIFQKASCNPAVFKDYVHRDGPAYLTKWNKRRIWGEPTC